MKWIVVLIWLLLSAAAPASAQDAAPDESAPPTDSVAVDSVMVDEWRIKARKIELKDELQMISREEIPGLRKWQRQKSARVAMYSTMVLPGLGQLYNERRIKTALVAGLSVFYAGRAWQNHKNAQRHLVLRDTYPVSSVDWRNENSWVEYYKESSLDYVWWFGAVWLISSLDAYIDAHLFDVRVYKPTLSSTGAGSGYLTVGITF